MNSSLTEPLRTLKVLANECSAEIKELARMKELLWSIEYPKSMVDMGPVRQDSLHTFEELRAYHTASKVHPPASSQLEISHPNDGQRLSNSSFIFVDKVEAPSQREKPKSESMKTLSIFPGFNETLKGGATEVAKAEERSASAAEETASEEWPVAIQPATGVPRSSVVRDDTSIPLSAILKRTVGAESSSEDEQDTTLAATRRLSIRSASSKGSCLDKLIGSVANSKPIVITEGDDEFDI